MPVLTFEQALATVLEHAAKAEPRHIETVPLLESAGRVLAQPITADRDQPPFDRATRDGFAVRASEWSSGQSLRLIGQVRAGEFWRHGELPTGTAVEIMTGAPVPPGADSVSMAEHAMLLQQPTADQQLPSEPIGVAAGFGPRKSNPSDRGDFSPGSFEVRAAEGRQLSTGENIVRRGSEARAGDVVVPPGTPITAAEIAEAATCGLADLQVYRRPKVAILATGDELVGLDDQLAPHQIRNSNSYALSALVETVGGFPGRLQIAKDTREDLRERILQGRMWDLLLLSGGVSAGKYDFVEDVLAGFGAEFLFTGVRMQPGKPVVFGRIPARQRHLLGTPEPECPGFPAISDCYGGECYFFGLPGNPISTEVTFHCFVAPMIRALSGADVGPPRFVQATLTEDVTPKAGLTRILPARLTPDLHRPTVRLIPWHGSGDLAANARANCYAVLADDRRFHSGDVITVLLR